MTTTEARTARDKLLVVLGKAWRDNGYTMPPLGVLADALLKSGLVAAPVDGSPDHGGNDD